MKATARRAKDDAQRKRERVRVRAELRRRIEALRASPDGRIRLGRAAIRRLLRQIWEG